MISPASSASSSRPTSRCPVPARKVWTNCSTRPAPSSSPIRSNRKKFTKRIAFNVIPHIDSFMEDGYTKEEWKVLAETKKMLDPKIKVTCTAVRVPVFIGHSESVNIEFEKRDHRRSGSRYPARGTGIASSSTSTRTAATSRRMNRPAKTRPTSRASAKTRR